MDGGPDLLNPVREINHQNKSDHELAVFWKPEYAPACLFGGDECLFGNFCSLSHPRFGGLDLQLWEKFQKYILTHAHRRALQTYIVETYLPAVNFPIPSHLATSLQALLVSAKVQFENVRPASLTRLPINLNFNLAKEGQRAHQLSWDCAKDKLWEGQLPGDFSQIIDRSPRRSLFMSQLTEAEHAHYATLFATSTRSTDLPFHPHHPTAPVDSSSHPPHPFP